MTLHKIIDIDRFSPDEGRHYRQSFAFTSDDRSTTVAAALCALNEHSPLLDIEGSPAAPIRFSCSCLQKKCGACAMRINGRPALACDVFLADLPGDHILLEPLRKFPVIADLEVDRGVMSDNLRTAQPFLTEEARLLSWERDRIVTSSLCLQCGLCLEVCPAFAPGGAFLGMAAGVPLIRVLSEAGPADRKRLRASYRKHIYAGCGTSLACSDICPAGIDITELAAWASADAVWHR